MEYQVENFVLRVDGGKGMVLQTIQPTGCVDKLSQALEMHFSCFVICVQLLLTP